MLVLYKHVRGGEGSEGNAKKCLRNEKMKKLFKENPKLHEMETRNKEKYEITHARTSRFKKSPIIYMQRLLNEH